MLTSCYPHPLTSFFVLFPSKLYDDFQVMAVDMSYRLGWIDDSIVNRVNNILKRAKLPTAPPDVMTVDMFKSVMAVSETSDLNHTLKMKIGF